MAVMQTRTCVGCGQVATRADLLRFTVQDGELTFDPHRRQLGRGAWVHASSECVEKGLQPARLSRSFRAAVKPGADVILAVRQHLSLEADKTDDTNRVTDD